MLVGPKEICYFIEVSNTLNVTRAAERLGISQPSLSLAIKRIEKALDTKIINRNKNGVTLTSAGGQLLKYASNLIKLWDELNQKVLSSEAEPKGLVSIGMHPSVAKYSVAKFLPEIIVKYPKLSFKLSHDLSRKITEEIISAKLDLGIVVNPVKHPDLILRKLCTDEVGVYTSPDKTFDNGSKTIICDPDLTQSQTILNNIKRQNINISRVISTSSLDVIIELVASGAGLGILPAGVIKHYTAKNLQLMTNMPTYFDEIYLAYRLEQKNVPAIQVVKDCIVARLTKCRNLNTQY